MEKGLLTRTLDVFALGNWSCQIVFQKSCHVTEPLKDVYFLGNRVHILCKIDLK